MDEGRKYGQRGYMDSGGAGRRERHEERPRPKGPKQPLDVTGPRLPRMVKAVAASRCYNCAVTLPTGTDFAQECPKCGVPLHCCKQCTYFEPSTRFQCLKPIPERIASKDKANECEWFTPVVTVARDTGHTAAASNGSRVENTVSPKDPRDARAMFDSLFKK